MRIANSIDQRVGTRILIDGLSPHLLRCASQRSAGRRDSPKRRNDPASEDRESDRQRRHHLLVVTPFRFHQREQACNFLRLPLLEICTLHRNWGILCSKFGRGRGNGQGTYRLAGNGTASLARDLAPGKQIIFAACGVTEGALLHGVRFFGEGCRTHALTMTYASKQVRFVDTVHMNQEPGRMGVRLY